MSFQLSVVAFAKQVPDDDAVLKALEVLARLSKILESNIGDHTNHNSVEVFAAWLTK